MFCQPRKRLTGCQRLAHDVGGRRSVFEHRYIAEVLARHAWIRAQSLNTELRQTEALNLRNVNSPIEVEQVGRRTMSLIAHFDTMTVSPFHPLLGEVLVEQVTQRLTIVCEYLIAVINIA